MISWIQPSGITWLGQTPPAAFMQKEIVTEKKELDTQDKILILSLFLGVATLAWQIYEWRTRK